MMNVNIKSRPKGSVMGAKFLALRSEIGERVHDQLEATEERLTNVIRERYLSRSGSKSQIGRYTGTLQRSITAKLGEGLRQARVTIRSDSPYAAAWEYGRKAGRMPPLGPLQRWAQFVLGDKNIGFLIARKMAKQGVWRRPFVGPARREVLGYKGKFFAEKIKAALEGIGRGE